jgi:starvation-inducible DNA-binding protein
MVVSDVLRTNELQVWFVSEHLVNEPLVEAEDEAETNHAGRKSA